jgi:hypothetical protein
VLLLSIIASSSKLLIASSYILTALRNLSFPQLRDSGSAAGSMKPPLLP